ncbi:MAG: spore coat U domain-containing protein [Aestuariivirgaceae bacterium]|nr:spore coat U domain-containing protein [Aestuariivirgaceae bacterium]
MRQYFLSGCCAYALTLFAGAASLAQAQTTSSASMGVSLQVTAQCSVNSVNAMNFGTQDISGGSVDHAASFELNCTRSTPFTVGIDAGAGAGATSSARKMTGAASGQTISYQLYMDEAHTRNWGNDASQSLAGTGSGGNQSFTVYARVPEQAAPAPDSYTDNVTLSVTY